MSLKVLLVRWKHDKAIEVSCILNEDDVLSTYKYVSVQLFGTDFEIVVISPDNSTDFVNAVEELVKE